MNTRIVGERPRPRVVIVGELDPDALERLKGLFPTVWQVENIAGLSDLVDYRENDLLILGVNATSQPYNSPNNNWLQESYWPYAESAHLISFSEELIFLPGPIDQTVLYNDQVSTVRECYLPGLPLPLERQRASDLEQTDSVKDWRQYRLASLLSDAAAERASEVENQLIETALILSAHDQLPLAGMYIRESSELGVAFLPGTHFDQYAWINLIAQEWAKSDPDGLPGLSDWASDPAWMVPQERAIAEKIEELETEKSETIKRIDQELQTLSQELADARIIANRGRRRLLTAQDDELVEEVEELFTELGFRVENVDEVLPEGAPKREDLRLRLPDNDSWEAIVEVRGYRRSGGRTRDLGRLSRFARLYQQETGDWPDQLIYIVNGQIEITDPSLRQEPLAPAEEDVEEFANNDGVVIATTELFHVAQSLDGLDPVQVRKSISQARGRWRFEDI